MDVLTLSDLCLSLPGARASQPFGPDVIVYKVGGRMFAATRPDVCPPRVNLKCDPEQAIELREAYPAITPGWHMNKVHWNTVVLDGTVPSHLVRELVRHSYTLVVARTRVTAAPSVERRRTAPSRSRRRSTRAEPTATGSSGHGA